VRAVALLDTEVAIARSTATFGLLVATSCAAAGWYVLTVEFAALSVIMGAVTIAGRRELDVVARPQPLAPARARYLTEGGRKARDADLSDRRLGV